MAHQASRYSGQFGRITATASLRSTPSSRRPAATSETRLPNVPYDHSTSAFRTNVASPSASARISSSSGSVPASIDRAPVIARTVAALALRGDRPLGRRLCE
jgi:hypothetical protein